MSVGIRGYPRRLLSLLRWLCVLLAFAVAFLYLLSCHVPAAPHAGDGYLGAWWLPIERRVPGDTPGPWIVWLGSDRWGVAGILHPGKADLVVYHNPNGAWFGTDGALMHFLWRIHATRVRFRLGRVLVGMLVAAIVLDVLLRFPFSRRRTGLGCARCGYNLTANTSGVCPECGESILPAEGGQAVQDQV